MSISKGIIISLAFTAVCSVAWASPADLAKNPLLFPKDNFTEETKTVRTSSGEKKVTYRCYMHIPYVAKSIDTDYQSLNVSVPIKVDDVAIDAINAPILFVIGVGGYMSSKNAGRRRYLLRQGSRRYCGPQGGGSLRSI